MALTVGTNSYIALVDAETYISERYTSDTWDDAEDAAKEQALMRATQNIDLLLLRGRKVSSDQTLQFPRAFLSPDGYKEEEDYSVQLLAAVCEEALYYIVSQAGTETSIVSDQAVNHLKELGITSFGLGDESYQFDKKMGRIETITGYTQRLLRDYINPLFKIV